MKQKRQLAALIALLVIAAAVWGWYFRTNQLGAPAETVSAAPNYHLLAVENPHIRIEEIAKARQAEYKSTGRNIFSAATLPPVSHSHSAEPPKIVWNSPCGAAVGPCPPPPPPPPVLPAKFFGYGSGPKGTARRAFLLDGDEKVYIVPEGQLFLNRYRILKIGNASLEFEELSSGRKGTAPLEEQPAGPSA